MAALLAVVVAVASSPSPSPSPATVIRFLDHDGMVRYGHPVDASNSEADLVDGFGALVTPATDDVFEASAGASVPRPIALKATGVRVKVKRVLAPIPKPSMIYGIGLNYLEHARQANLTVPHHPAVFFKNRNAYNHPDSLVIIPTESSLPDFEGELAVVVGPRACLNEDASNPESIFGPKGCVLGFTAANDVSARCWQSDTSVDAQCFAQNETYHPKPIGQWSFSKSFDSHAPFGPALLLANKNLRWGPDVGDADYFDGSDLRLKTYLNGNLMQNQTTSDMIFDVAKIIAFLSTSTTLDAGTIIVTGTPGGVGYTRTPPILLQDGDNVTIAIEPFIGALTNTISRTTP